MNKNITIFLLLSIFLTTQVSYAQTELSFTKTMGERIEARGRSTSKIIRDPAGNFYVVRRGRKKLKEHEYIEVFDPQLQHKQTIDPDFPIEETITGIESVGEKIILVSSPRSLVWLNSGTVAYGVPDQNVYLQIMDAEGNLSGRKPISLFEENEQAGSTLKVLFSRDKSKMLFFTQSKSKKKKIRNMTCWVYDTNSLEMIWQRHFICARTPGLYNNDILVTNAGNVLLMDSDYNMYLVKESDEKPQKLRVSAGGGKKLSHPKFKEMPSGKLLVCGGFGTAINSSQGIFIDSIEEETGTVTMVGKDIFPVEIFSFYGKKAKDMEKGKGIYYLQIENILETEAEGYVLSFEKIHRKLVGDQTYNMFKSPLILKIDSEGKLNQWWTIPSNYQDLGRRGGGHLLFLKNSQPYVLMNSHEDNLSGEVIKEKQAKKLAIPDRSGSKYRGDRVDTFLIKLKEDRSITYKKLYELTEDQVYLSTEKKIFSDSPDSFFATGIYKRNLELFQLKF